MTTTYELRTVRNTPVHAFDNEKRAREAMKEAEKRVGTSFRLVRITRTEEVIS